MTRTLSLLTAAFIAAAATTNATEMCVVNYAGGFGFYVETYYTTNSGNVYPVRTISGTNTLMDFPYAPAVDTGFVYIANYNSKGTNTITVYEANANGSNVSPVRSISSGYLDLSKCIDIDSEHIYVGTALGIIGVYNLDDDGYVEPQSRIYGQNTGMEDIGGIAVDSSYIYAGLDQSPGVIAIFNLTDNGNTAPVRTISSTNSGLRSIRSLAVDDSYIYVLNDSYTTTNQGILVFDKNASGESVPVRTIRGSNTDMSDPRGMAIDSEYIFITDRNNAVIKAYSITANGNVAPHHWIEPEYPNQSCFAPWGIAIAPFSFTVPTNTSTACNDYDGDGKSDIAVNWTEAGYWYVLLSSSDTLLNNGPVPFGWNETVPVPGDFDGDGKTDMAVFHHSAGTWYVLRSSDSTMQTIQFGWDQTDPVQGDYDGDGKTDPAVFHSASATWYMLLSSDSTMRTLQWGWAGATPVRADFDGDGICDPTAYDNATATWYVHRSSDNTMATVQWGWADTEPLTGDFDGDGSDDMTAFYPSTAAWYVLQSSDSRMMSDGPVQFGWSGATILPGGDYDGDGKSDLTAWDPATGNWYIRRSSDLQLMSGGPIQFGWSAAPPVQP